MPKGTGNKRKIKACDSLTNKHQVFLCMKDTRDSYDFFFSLYFSVATYCIWQIAFIDSFKCPIGRMFVVSLCLKPNGVKEVCTLG